jgi:hypothetical protein
MTYQLFIRIARLKIRRRNNNMARRYKDLKDKILSNIIVDKNTGCWNWTGTLNRVEGEKRRYGRVFVGSTLDGTGKRIMAHRASYMAFVEMVPDELCVCHKCDNPKCVNPNHLFLGTKKDNAKDMVKKGRSLSRYGAENPNHKLSSKDVLIIRKSNYSLPELGRKFNVSPNTIFRIKHNQTWSNLSDDSKEDS